MYQSTMYYLLFFALRNFRRKMGIGESLAIRERVRILDIGNGPKSNHKKRAACKIPIYVVCRVGDTKDAGKGKLSAWFFLMVHMVRR